MKTKNKSRIKPTTAYRIDPKIAEKFKLVCDKHGFVMSRMLEIMLEEFIILHGGKRK